MKFVAAAVPDASCTKSVCNVIQYESVVSVARNSGCLVGAAVKEFVAASVPDASCAESVQNVIQTTALCPSLGIWVVPSGTAGATDCQHDEACRRPFFRASAMVGSRRLSSWREESFKRFRFFERERAKTYASVLSGLHWPDEILNPSGERRLCRGVPPLRCDASGWPRASAPHPIPLLINV